MDKNISIITNFGCTRNCRYCVWKNHVFSNIKDSTDWNNLKKFLTEFCNKGKVSVSGGGDPLYYFDINNEKIGWEWFNSLFAITEQLDMKVDIHTRVKYYNEEFWRKINRVNFSVINLYSAIDFLKWLNQYTKVRIVYVIEEYTEDKYIEMLIDFCKNNNMQLTLKQLYGQNDKGKYKYFKKKYTNVFFLDHDDYNLYYMPNNLVYDKFII